MFSRREQHRPDGTEIATGSLDGTVKLWNAESGRERATFLAHTNGVTRVLFTPDGQGLITTGCDNAVRRWRKSTQELLAQCVIGEFKPDDFLLASLNGDGRLIAVAGWEGALHLLDGRSLTRIGSWRGRGRNWDVCWSPDDERLITISSRSKAYVRDYGSVDIWSTREPREILTAAECPELITALSRHPDDARLATSSVDFTLRQWETFPWGMNARADAGESAWRERVQQYARTYWQQRLAAEATSPPPLREVKVPFDRRLVPQRDEKATVAQVDLTEFYTGLLSDPLYPPFSIARVDNDLSNLPVGLVELGGIVFDVRAVIRLRATHPKGEPWTLNWNRFPVRIEGIRIGRTFERLHLLHGAAGGWIHTLDGAKQAVPDGAPIARFTYHYADGSRHTEEIVYGRYVREWWEGAGDPAEIQRGEVAWRGTNPIAASYGARLRLYRSTWVNPEPEKVVTRMDYESLLTACGYFVVAITVE